MNKRTIVLKGELREWHEEKTASGAIKPGMLVELLSNDKVQAHSIRGGRNTRWFAKEDAHRGGTTAGLLQDGSAYYADTDVCFLHRAQRGDRIAMLLQVGENVAIGDYLIGYGDGTVCKAASSMLANNVAASTATGASSAAEVTFSNGTITIPANTLKVGSVIRIRGHVVYSATHSTDTATVKVKVGSTAIATSPAVDVADGDLCLFDIRIVVRTIGASGTLVANGFINLGVPGTATTRAGHLASTAVDTTAAVTLTVTNTFSVSDAGNICALQSLTVEHVAGGTTIGGPPSGVGDVVGQVQAALDLSAASANDLVDAEVL